MVYLMAFAWRKFTKVIFAPLLLCALYFEWICYLPINYPNLGCGLIKNVHKILFVADPQILGENTESFIARTDCDRFLKLTFHNALNYVKPDLIVFLGDLMDEGSIATGDQYKRYYRRFRDIFQLDYIHKNKTIFIPGDNDIGGEFEEVTEFKTRRFTAHFPTPDVVKFKNITFLKVNSMTKKFPDFNVENDTSIRILISHVPLLGIWSTFGEQAISQLKPLLVFSAHEHKSMHLVTGINSPTREYVESLNGEKWRFSLANSGRVNEIVVPTSSYRMGTLEVGYGVAVLSTKGDVMCYFILSSPKRLLHLMFYLLLISCITIGFIIYLLMPLWCRRLRYRSTKYMRLFTEV